MKSKNTLSQAEYALLLSGNNFIKKPSKYRAIKTANKDQTISDSRKEARLDETFMMLIKNKNILKVIRKERFIMQINGIKICAYVADWTVYHKDGHKEIYDAKGFKTPVYKIKKKLLKALYNLNIIEI
jgi:hypothetical protein